MKSLYFIAFSFVWFYLYYKYYIGGIEKKIIKPSKTAQTPAQKFNDGVDYYPSNPYVLFGHHFSSIAGAGPIIGPILAYSLFGWGPSLLWILFGTVFIGTVHDYLSLMVSLRNNGVSIAEIAEKEISPPSKWLFSIFVYFSLVLIVTVFANITAKTLESKPEIVIPTVGLIFVAMLFGFALYKLKLKVIPLTIISWLLIFGLVYAGYKYPIYGGFKFWFYIFLVYAYIASSLPVWLLLQPRDFLSMTILFVGLFFGYIGIGFLNPEVSGPIYVNFNSSQGPLIPMLFVIIACGSISGFHSLVASGTTAKQLAKETHGKPIGAGGMIFESILAVLVLLLSSAVLPWKGGETSFISLLKHGPIVTFGTAYGKALGSISIPLSLGIAFGILMLNAFVLTTLDTAVRLGRFVFQEAFVKNSKFLSNRWIAGGIIIVLSWIFAITGGWRSIWPAFGSANQLIAAFSLFTVSAYIMGKKKKSLVAMIPGFFMFTITETALIYLLIGKYGKELISGKLSNIAIVTVVLVLIIIGFFMLFEFIKKLRKR